jgi:hypothetical protein
LRELFQWSVLDRFQPFISLGTAPMHYVLAPAGAAVLAAAEGLDIKELGYRHDRVLGIAHSLRLAHTVGVNDWFTALVHDPNATVTAWWAEARCTRHFGDLIKPDAYGRLTIDQNDIEFFLEYDFGTENLTKLAHKLTGYTALAAATGITTPILVWFPTARREASARSVLRQFRNQLDQPDTVPLATASAEHLAGSDPSPADAVWLTLDPGHTAGRQHPQELLGAWPQVTPPTPDPEPNAARHQDVRLLPPPPPVAPSAG